MLRSVPALLLAALLASVTPGAGRAAPADGQQFKDWTARCESAQDPDTGPCYLVQNLLLKSQKKRLLHVAVGFMQNDAQGKQPAAFFTLPLGVSLPGGISLTVDSGKALRMRYERCDATGCLAPLALTEDLIKALKGGRWARVAFFDANRREVSVPVSLLGFTAGFESLVE